MSTPLQDDLDFEDVVIDEARRHDDGSWSISYDGCGFGGIPADTPVQPKKGMVARLYSNGLGSRVRGVCLDGVTIYYRTKAEDKEQAEIDRYGKDAADWISRWDAGNSVWSIEMGGIGPGYEQAIQTTVAEIIRHMLAARYDAAFWTDKDQWKADREKIEKTVFENETVKKMGLSGAQWGAALSLASSLYMRGPREIMNDDAVKDRHILVSKSFP